MSKGDPLTQQKTKASLLQHLHDNLSSGTISVNTLLNVETPLKFNFSANIVIGSLSHRPWVDIFQFQLVFFETPHVTKPWNSVVPIVHASLNSLESYLFMSN
jgi:hypothetical protein